MGTLRLKRQGAALVQGRGAAGCSCQEGLGPLGEAQVALRVEVRRLRQRQGRVLRRPGEAVVRRRKGRAAARQAVLRARQAASRQGPGQGQPQPQAMQSQGKGLGQGSRWVGGQPC